MEGRQHVAPTYDTPTYDAPHCAQLHTAMIELPDLNKLSEDDRLVLYSFIDTCHCR